LWFRTENQSCAEWAIDLRENENRDDPSVHVLTAEDYSSRLVEAASFSEFAALVLFLEGIWKSERLGLGSRLNANIRAELEAAFVPADLPGQYWVMNPARVWESSEVYCIDSPSDGLLYMAAQTGAAYARLPPSLREPLDWVEPRR
jgi:hypothetical protein